MTTYCPVCGKRHPELASCKKYGVHICSRHCDTCQYRLGGKLMSPFCGYGANTKATGVPVYLALPDDVKKEKEKMRTWHIDKVAQRYSDIKELYNNGNNAEQNLHYRPILAACQQLMYERVDSLLAEEHIPQMPTDEILEYRLELCRLITENKMNETLKSAVNKALELCCIELNKRREAV